MADEDPYAKYLKPGSAPAPAAPTAPTSAPAASSDTDPYSKFLPASQATPASTTAAAPSVPLFSLGGTGNDKVGEFLAKAGDTATFGLGAKLQDALGIGQKDGQTVAQQVEAGGKDIGPVASAGADLLGYVAGPGELRVGEGLGKLIGSGLSRGIGENVASRVGGRMIGSGIEGTGATILGAAGHDQDLTFNELLKSAALSAATGALPGGAGKRPTTPLTADLQSTASGLYKPLESKVYQSPDVVTALDRAGAGVSQGLEAKMSSNLADQIARINGIVSKGTKTTASDIADFRSSLMGAARTDTDKTIAGQYLASLDKGVGSQTAADIAAANRASNIAKTSSDIEGWAATPGKAPAAVKSALENSPNFYKTQPGLFNALNAVGKRADTGPLSPSTLGYEAAKHIGTGLLGGAVTHLIGGGNPYEDVGGSIAGFFAPRLVAAGLNKARNSQMTNRLLAAQHLNATGMKVDPSVYTNMGLQVPGMLARQTGYGLGAGGAF